MNFDSHPGKPLVQHLVEVRDYSIHQVPFEYKKAYEMIALCHDFGKYTSFFQRYLKDNEKSSLSNHGFISAIFGAYLSLLRLGEESILPLIVYNTIIHHHGNLENPSSNLPNSFKNISINNLPPKIFEKVDIGYIQIQDIRNNIKSIKEDMNYLNISLEFEEFIGKQNVIEDTLGKLKRLELLSKRNLKSEKNYFIHQLLYSFLISADKISASNTPIFGEKYVEFEEMEKARIDKFGKPRNLIDSMRTEIFTNVIDTIEKEYKNGKIFSITAPTGTGKTMTGFFAALKLKKLIGGDRKIIYSLPFTSIIEQNYDAIYGLFNIIEDFQKNFSSYIIKHHNLSTVEYESEYRDYSKTEAELLIENWSSGVIITTFVQLLETLVGSRNRMLKKFSSIRSSIIILDEVQAIDIKYFELVDYILKKACEYLDVRIIVMTATKPIILTEAIELLENNNLYFEQFNRTKLMPNVEYKTLNEFIDDFTDELEEKSYMIVCNTIKQSLKIYEELKTLDRDVYYLSTNILPIHRRQRIEEIKDRLFEGDKIILVSTQVVEAGVDLDFDVVVRDMGPIDSIIQCAGRCNRNNKNEIGEVYVYSIIDDTGRSYGSYVYGHTLMDITRSLLKKEETIYEKDYYELINKYFKKIKENKSQQISRNYIESIEKLDFSDGEYPLAKFSLIQNNPGYIDVFFIYDDVAELTYEKYRALSSIKNYKEKREKYLDIQKNIKDYTISVPAKYFRTFTSDSGMIFLPREGIDQFYNFETGFIREDDNECIIF
ncbi:CRISPR-associated helicase Cas3' [Clostridium sp. Cult2]|uniref:CRISPR-associated helicase Cas3' n=1 Tax=Clostridium sp. Cult2 TaxID=2079003 RepID=UPI001F01CB28|nr:CRISPR-associated helicase Cas3' [Clostridium sp. Cult2]MCF6464458.1 CRISPR-associated helicase/endonuclease Cas3 [Clostridium sp. Cult2]